MTSFTCLLAVVLALITVPLVIIWRLSLTPQQHAKRLRAKGLTYRAIGSQINVSHTTARRYCLA